MSDNRHQWIYSEVFGLPWRICKRCRAVWSGNPDNTNERCRFVSAEEQDDSKEVPCED